MTTETNNGQSDAEACVVVLCGLPGSGKSFLARSIISLAESDKPPLSFFDKIVHIEYDVVALEIAASTKQSQSLNKNQQSDDDGTLFNAIDLEAWRNSRSRALEYLENELDSFFSQPKQQQHHRHRCSFGDERAMDDADNFECENTKERLLILMDDNFHLRSMRRDVLKACQRRVRSNNTQDDRIIGFSVLFVDAPTCICIERNQERSGKSRVPNQVILDMSETLERPDSSKSSFECHSVRINHDQISFSTHDAFLEPRSLHPPNKCLDSIVNCIQMSLKHPIISVEQIMEDEIAEQKRKLEERTKTMQSKLHRYDRMLRILVGSVGKVNPKKARLANEARKQIFDELKHGEDSLLGNDYDNDDDDDAILSRFETLVFKDCNEQKDTSTTDCRQAARKAFEDFVSRELVS